MKTILTLSLQVLTPFALFAEPTDEKAVLQLDPFQVIGSEEAGFHLSGSGSYFGPTQLERFKFDSIVDITRQTPGVYARDDDGFGLFPNISIRGVDTNRSAKLTLMEDGVLAAPAPYSAPSAYYSPTAGRMAGIEILKGSSQIAYGPQTTGGVINYISTPIPEEAQGFFEFSYGNYKTAKGQLWYGGTKKTESGTVGALVEFYREQSDGFREIEPSVNGVYAGSDDTGFDKTDAMVKLSFEPNWKRKNRLELKLGYTDFAANETYLGLAPGDLSEDPWLRYAATSSDHIESQQFRGYLRHEIAFDTDSHLRTALYYNAFRRDWFKLDSIAYRNTDADSELDYESLSSAVANPAGQNVLRGVDRGNFDFLSNDREYYQYGIQSEWTKAFETGEWRHALKIGARLHKDKIDRFQDGYYFDDVYAGDFDFSSPDRRTGPESEGDREQETAALALFAHDRVSVGDWVFSPGIRYEYIQWDYIRRDRRTPATTADGSYSVLAYGLGFEYFFSSETKLFGGYHRGFSVPSPGSRREGLDEEISDTFELGYRFQNRKNFHAEAVIFYTALHDLIVEENISGGGSGNENAGDIDTLGLEITLSHDLSDYLDTRYGLPLRLAFTYTDSTLNGDIESEAADFIFKGQDGAKVPYIPDFQVSFTTGIEFETFQAYALLTYVGERYASALNSDELINNNGNPDARFGQLDSYLTLDLSAFYQINEDFELFARINNVFEAKYIASQLPHGPRSGAPRLFSAGFNYRF